LSIRLQELSEDGERWASSPVERRSTSTPAAPPPGLLENPHNDLTSSKSPHRARRAELHPALHSDPEQIPDYNVTYLTTERIDEVDTYLFHLEPNHPARPNERLFEGIIWVDARKLDIVRAHGRALPSHSSGALKEYFRRVEVFREPVDGYLFPTYVRADDVLSVRDVPLKARLVVRFRNHTRAANSGTSLSMLRMLAVGFAKLLGLAILVGLAIFYLASRLVRAFDLARRDNPGISALTARFRGDRPT
jgi:hypothetical protein